MGRRRAAPSEPQPEADPADETQVETVDPEPQVEEQEQEQAPPEVEEAQASVHFKGPASAVRRAAARLGSTPAARPANGAQHEPEEDDSHNDKLGELLVDGRNKIIITRSSPKRFKGQKVRPIRIELDCPVTIEQIEEELYANYGGKIFRVAIYPNTATAETKPPLGAFTLTNAETDEPWEPEDLEEQEEEQRGGFGGDQFASEDKSPAAIAKRTLQKEAESLEQEIEVKRLKRLRKQADLEDEGDRPDPADDRVRQLEERLTIKDVEAKLDAKLNAVLDSLKQNQQPRGADPMIEMMKFSQQQFTQMMTMMQKSSTDMMTAITQMNRQPKEDPLDNLAKLAQLKNLFGGESDRVNSIVEMALDKMFNGDDNGKPESEDSDMKYAINKLEPLIQKLVDKGIDATGKTKEQLSAEEVKKIQLEAATKVAKELEAKWTAEGMLVKAPVGLPAPKPGQQPQPTGRENMNIPPTPAEPGYDRKLAVNFILDVAIDDMKKGCPDNSFLVMDIVEGLDREILEEFARIESGAQLDAILSAWGDPAKIAEVKRLGQDQRTKIWLSRVVTTAQQIIVEAKAQAPQPEKK